MSTSTSNMFAHANLSGAWFRDADLSYADLSYADLSYADLAGANLTGANLTGANLYDADLACANLTGANLTRAQLDLTELGYADLAGANLTRTCLDPCSSINPGGQDFETFFSGRHEWAIGYRTSKPLIIVGPEYLPGIIYEAHAFSTSRTDCHPGLYLMTSVEKVRKLLPGTSIISVITFKYLIHKADNKYRAPWFIVWEKVT